MSKIVISMLTAIVAVGCTTVVVEYPLPDASPIDGAPAIDGASDDDATAADAGDAGAADADVVADAAPDVVVVPDVCVDADNPDCCLNGQPIRVGLVCGDYPDSANAACNGVGVCAPQVAQTCFDTNACCDGWSPIFETFSAPCHCEVDLDADPPFVTGSPYHRACKNEPNEGAGNAMGYCGMAYVDSIFANRPDLRQQYTCISNTTWTP